jgi:hypothetical protein
MKAEQIRSLIHKVPFKPVKIELDNGRTVIIKHPDFLFFNESGNTAIVTEENEIQLIGVEHISAVKSALK